MSENSNEKESKDVEIDSGSSWNNDFPSIHNFFKNSKSHKYTHSQTSSEDSAWYDEYDNETTNKYSADQLYNSYKPYEKYGYEGSAEKDEESAEKDEESAGTNDVDHVTVYETKFLSRYSDFSLNIDIEVQNSEENSNLDTMISTSPRSFTTIQPEFHDNKKLNSTELYHNPICLLVGPKNVGKTTLYKRFLEVSKITYDSDKITEKSFTLNAQLVPVTAIDSKTHVIHKMLVFDKSNPSEEEKTNLDLFQNYTCDMVIYLIDINTETLHDEIIYDFKSMQRSDIRFIVALNKIDYIPGWSKKAQVLEEQSEEVISTYRELFDKLHYQLAEHGFYITDYRKSRNFITEIPAIPISAKNNQGLDELMKAVDKLGQKYMFHNLIIGNPEAMLLDMISDRLLILLSNGSLKTGNKLIINTVGAPPGLGYKNTPGGVVLNIIGLCEYNNPEKELLQIEAADIFLAVVQIEKIYGDLPEEKDLSKVSLKDLKLDLGSDIVVVDEHSTISYTDEKEETNIQGNKDIKNIKDMKDIKPEESSFIDQLIRDIEAENAKNNENKVEGSESELILFAPNIGSIKTLENYFLLYYNDLKIVGRGIGTVTGQKLKQFPINYMKEITIISLNVNVDEDVREQLELHKYQQQRHQQHKHQHKNISLLEGKTIPELRTKFLELKENKK